jgi:hypothetical protein
MHCAHNAHRDYRNALLVSLLVATVFLVNEIRGQQWRTAKRLVRLHLLRGRHALSATLHLEWWNWNMHH